MKTTLIEDLKDFRTPICEGLNAKLPDVEGIADYLTAKGYRKASEVAREIFEEIERYIRLNEDIALKCKQENGNKNEEYWKGKLSAFKQVRGFIDVELKRQYTEGKYNG